MKFALRIFVALIAFGASTYVSAQGRTEEKLSNLVDHFFRQP